MTLLDNADAKLTKRILPDWILWSLTAITGLLTSAKIFTILLFGFGDNYTSVKVVAICIVILTILLILGLGEKAELALSINNENSAATVSIILTHKNKVIINCEEAISHIKIVYMSYSEDLVIEFRNKVTPYRIRITGKKEVDTQSVVNSFNKVGTKIKIIDDSPREQK